LVAAISGLGVPQESNSFALRVLAPGEPSLRTAPKPKRTLLTLQRGSHNWSLAPSPVALAIGTLTPHANLFDRVDIEAGQSSAADVDHTLVAQSPSGEKLSFSPAGHLTDLDGQPFTVPLNAARFAIDFETSQTFLSARFPARPIWFQTEGFALEIADLANAPVFEVDATAGAVSSLTCAPALRRACAPLPGSLTAKPLPLSGTSPLHFVASPGSTPGWGVLTRTAAPGSPKLSLPEFAVGLLRRDDLLSLELLFTNLALEGAGGQSPRLAKIDGTKDALITARFNAPQNLAEQAFEEQPPEPLVTPPVAVLSTGPSRLVFTLAGNANSLAYTVDSLFDWKQFDLNVTRAAALPDPPPQPANPPSPAAPLASETAIEAPWRLLLSPNATAAFAHASSAVTRGTRTELWHTRLGVKKVIAGTPHVDEQDSSTRKVRAIWASDFQKPPPPPGGGPFRMSLDANDRAQIVVRSADFSNPQLPPRAIDVDRLMLSALGAWMDVDGRWDAQGAFTIIKWRHRAAMARDSYVKVVKLGHLVPFGHRAVLIEITERKFLENPAGRTTAYLMKRQYIVVKEPEKDYGYLATATANQGRDFPYQRVRITTLVTPNLDTPDNQGQHFFPRGHALPVPSDRRRSRRKAFGIHGTPRLCGYRE
jgi:hypothetical protein